MRVEQYLGSFTQPRLQQGFGQGTAQRRIGSRPELIQENQVIRTCNLQGMGHQLQMRCISGQILVQVLPIPHAQNHSLHQAGCTGGIARQGPTALEKDLQKADRFEKY